METSALSRHPGSDPDRESRAKATELRTDMFEHIRRLIEAGEHEAAERAMDQLEQLLGAQ